MSKTILLNQNWIFSKEGHDEPVTLPHTWNAIDGQDGGNDYYRGTCSYTTVLPDISLPENGRAVLQFDAVAMTAEVYLNEQKLAEHKGGYSAFCVDITDALRNGSNLLRVNVDNSDNDTVYPQKADFTFYGGILPRCNAACCTRCSLCPCRKRRGAHQGHADCNRLGRPPL